MKKQINQIIIVLGFVVAVIGACLAAALSSVAGFVSTTAIANIAALLAVTFIFANHSVIKNIGYTLAALLAIDGIAGLMIVEVSAQTIGFIIYCFGILLMTIGSLIYFLMQFLTYCGFVKHSKKNTINSCKGNLLDELIRYKEMQQEKVLTEEEFSELKQKMLENSENKSDSIDDLKKWKKLLDQQVITEEEFSKIKADIFCK